MQELSSQPVAASVAIAWVADQRMADRREVGANLMRAPGLETRLHQGVAVQQLEDLEVGTGRTRCTAANRATLRRPVVTPQGCIDGAGSGPGMALDQRRIDPLPPGVP